MDQLNKPTRTHASFAQRTAQLKTLKYNSSIRDGVLLIKKKHADEQRN